MKKRIVFLIALVMASSVGTVVADCFYNVSNIPGCDVEKCKNNQCKQCFNNQCRCSNRYKEYHTNKKSCEWAQIKLQYGATGKAASKNSIQKCNRWKLMGATCDWPILSGKIEFKNDSSGVEKLVPIDPKKLVCPDCGHPVGLHIHEVEKTKKVKQLIKSVERLAKKSKAASEKVLDKAKEASSRNLSQKKFNELIEKARKKEVLAKKYHKQCLVSALNRIKDLAGDGSDYREAKQLADEADQEIKKAHNAIEKIITDRKKTQTDKEKPEKEKKGNDKQEKKADDKSDNKKAVEKNDKPTNEDISVAEKARKDAANQAGSGGQGRGRGRR